MPYNFEKKVFQKKYNNLCVVFLGDGSKITGRTTYACRLDGRGVPLEFVGEDAAFRELLANIISEDAGTELLPIENPERSRKSHTSIKMEGGTKNGTLFAHIFWGVTASATGWKLETPAGVAFDGLFEIKSVELKVRTFLTEDVSTHGRGEG